MIANTKNEIILSEFAKDEILKKCKLRCDLLERANREDAPDELYKELEPEIDKFQEEILELIKTNFDILEFDFVMEQLSHLGWCVNLLNDDNGHWAVTCDGYQNLVYGDEPEDVETHFFVEAKEWQNSPKDALYKFLQEDNEEE